MRKNLWRYITHSVLLFIIPFSCVIPADDPDPLAITFLPAAGSFQVTPEISITTGDATAEIRFTRDGSDPVTSATAETYTAPFLFNGTLRAYASAAAKNGPEREGLFSVTGTISLPKTGQTNSIATGDDGDLEMGTDFPYPRFTIHSNGTLTDNLTGLMWEQTPVSTTYNWVNAFETRIADLNTAELGGYSDWRLPNRNEFRSLMNYGLPGGYLEFSGWLAGQGFYNLDAVEFWTSSTFYEDANYAWVVHLMGGHVLSGQKTSARRVLAVRGTTTGPASVPVTGQSLVFHLGDDDRALAAGIPWPSPRFNDNGNGTVTDNLTGLMWLKTPGTTGYSWSAACSTGLAAFNTALVGGYSDWRMPNVNELASIVNHGSGAGTVADWLNLNGFSEVPASIYWTSTCYAGDVVPSQYWFVSMGQGPVNVSSGTLSFRMWAVRAGQ
ncbi:MAG: DUF1566 domain-containing protein [Spirochaetales bacterium]|nr:DUF1566 domain-containing protein [Spirochaetales bacterium]